jgi:hypothetical protein
MKYNKIKKKGRLLELVYCGSKLALKTRYLRKDIEKKLWEDGKEEVYSYWTTLRKRKNIRH